MLNNTQADNDNNELNFTAFTDLCRFCSLRSGAKLNLFEKEAEQRQILYKVRSFLPIAVRLWKEEQKNVFFCYKIYVSNLLFHNTDIERWFLAEKNLWTMCVTFRTTFRMEKYLYTKWFGIEKLCRINESRYSNNQFSGIHFNQNVQQRKCFF